MNSLRKKISYIFLMSNLRSFKFFKLLEKRSGRNKPQSMVTFKSSAEEEETEEELEREAKRV